MLQIDTLAARQCGPRFAELTPPIGLEAAMIIAIVAIALATIAAIIAVCAIALWLDAPPPPRKPAGHGHGEGDAAAGLPTNVADVRRAPEAAGVVLINGEDPSVKLKTKRAASPVTTSTQAMTSDDA
jgi:hypothetical protein